MIILSSVAALALGAAPVQPQTPVQSQGPTGQATAAVTTQSTPTVPEKPVWKPKPKSWTLADTSKPVAKLPASAL